MNLGRVLLGKITAVSYEERVSDTNYI